MENFAGSGIRTLAGGTTAEMNGFDLQVPGAGPGGNLSFWIDSAMSHVNIPDNGTDWLYHGNPGPLTITRVGGGAFSITKFDAAFSQNSYLNNPDISNNIVAVGTLAGGGTISQTFTVADVLAFATFNFGAGWTNLLAVTFQSPLGTDTVGLMGYDNIVVDASAAVPLPAALPLFGTILAGGGLIAWRRKRKTAVTAA